MNNRPLVSVIIPIYKAEQFIENTVEHLMQQSYKNIEVICIDDASKDNSLSLCKKLEEKYQNFTVYQNIDESGCISNINLGQEAARNYGIQKSHGKYFIFLDADDSLQKETIKNCVEIAEASMADIVMFSFLTVIGSEKTPILSGVNNGLYEMDDFAKLLLNPIIWSIISCIGSKLYRTEVFKNKIKFDKKYKYNEDCAYALQALTISKTVYYIDYPYYEYLIQEKNSVMSSYRPGMFDTNKKVIELSKKLFEKYNCYASKEQDYYKRFFFMIMDSLINEVRFGSKESFIQTLASISKYGDFEKIVKCIRTSYSLKSWKYWFAILLERRKYNVLYTILQMREKYKFGR